MANQEQLEILKQGVDVWNKWREANPNDEIDLKGAELGECRLWNANLSQVDLTRANLSKAKLSFANFYGAKLTRANLQGADLMFANLDGADLFGINLIIADLRQAGLSNTNLMEADLSGANLNGARLLQAMLYRANLVGADLSAADLEGAHLTTANAREAKLIGAYLYGADIVRANLNSAILREANLSDANLSETELIGVNLSSADLSHANARDADLSGADLSNARLSEADLWNANLHSANLSKADLREADLSKANLTNANLTGANLRGAILVGTKIDKSRISGSSIYAVNVWDLEGKFEEQKDLVITPLRVPVITVDNIRVAQFIYLILNNEEIREAINTLSSKSVLILGRFADSKRKAISDALRNKLREYDLLPIVFDFDRPTDKDFTETIKTLAGLSYFVIADVTNPKSSPLELQAAVPDYQIPFVPIIQEGESPFAMMVDLQKKYNWVLNTVSYDSEETLMKALKPLIIDPAMKKRQELRLVKAQEPEIISAKEYLDKEKK